MKRSSKDVCGGDLYSNSLRHRRNLASVSNVCEAASRSLFWANGLNELPEFPFNLIGKSTMAFFTKPIIARTQILVHRWGGRTLKTGFTSPVAQASITTDWKVRTKGSMVIVTDVTVSCFYRRHCKDLQSVSSLARVRNRGNSFIRFCRDFQALSVLSGCPLY